MQRTRADQLKQGPLRTRPKMLKDHIALVPDDLGLHGHPKTSKAHARNLADRVPCLVLEKLRRRTMRTGRTDYRTHTHTHTPKPYIRSLRKVRLGSQAEAMSPDTCVSHEVSPNICATCGVCWAGGQHGTANRRCKSFRQPPTTILATSTADGYVFRCDAAWYATQHTGGYARQSMQEVL